MSTLLFLVAATTQPAAALELYGACNTDADCPDVLICVHDLVGSEDPVNTDTGPDSQVTDRYDEGATPILGPGYCDFPNDCPLDGCSFGGECHYDSQCADGLLCGASGTCEQDWDYCADQKGGCESGEGHCASDSECGRGLVCTDPGRADYGLDPNADVCLPPPPRGF